MGSAGGSLVERLGAGQDSQENRDTEPRISPVPVSLFVAPVNRIMRSSLFLTSFLRLVD